MHKSILSFTLIISVVALTFAQDSACISQISNIKNNFLDLQTSATDGDLYSAFLKLINILTDSVDLNKVCQNTDLLHEREEFGELSFECQESLDYIVSVLGDLNTNATLEQVLKALVDLYPTYSKTCLSVENAFKKTSSKVEYLRRRV